MSPNDIVNSQQNILDFQKILVKSSEPFWIPYYGGVDGVPLIPFSSSTVISKDPVTDSLGLSCNNGRSPLDKARGSKW